MPAPIQDTGLFRKTKHGLKRFSGSLELRGNIKDKTEDDDACRNTQDGLPHAANIFRCNDCTKRNRLFVLRQPLQPRRDPRPVKQETTNSRREYPQGRQSPRVSGAAYAEQGPC